MRHIVANIRAKKGYYLSPEEESLVYKLARSDCIESFDKTGKILGDSNPNALNYLLELPLMNWVSCAFPRPTFDNVTSNLSESANNWLGSELRSSDVVNLHFNFMRHLARNVNERR